MNLRTRIVWLLAGALACAFSAAAQDSTTTARSIRTVANLPATCKATSPAQVVIKTGSGAGVYWCSATNTWSGPLVSTSTSPGGTAGQVQFNDTTFGGDAGLTYDKTNDDLTIGRRVYSKLFVSPYVALTDAATVTWDLSLGQNATVTLTDNRTLSITNAVSGSGGCLIVKQDATGGRTLALPANSFVIGGGAGAVTLTATANAADLICFSYDGTNFYFNYGLNYN